MDNPGLFTKIKRGDRRAFDMLFRQYYKQLCGYSWKYVRSKEAVEDIVQKVFVQLWMKRKHLQITDSLSGYLYTSVRNESLIYLKSYHIRKRYETESVTDAENNEGNSEEDTKKLSEVIRGKVADLPDKCQEIFTLARFDGLTYDEIAAYLTISKKTVENQMGIAYKKLREWLIDDFRSFSE